MALPGRQPRYFSGICSRFSEGDRSGKHDERSSCWIRVAQPVVQGPQVSPMIGDEVVVAFEDGDPDRPIALGRLYP
jgi:type VI secretion system secreted protein VgrG